MCHVAADSVLDPLTMLHDRRDPKGERRFFYNDGSAAVRPNIVLDGLPPNLEDVIAEIAVGSSSGKSLLFGDLCVRCPVTQVLQDTGKKRDGEPLTWLSKNRPSRPPENKGATFAVNGVFGPHSFNHVIHPGEDFTILREK